MEVMCLNCGKMFSVDDHEYKGDWENHCSAACRRAWLENKAKEEQKRMTYDGANPFVWSLEEKTDGV